MTGEPELEIDLSLLPLAAVVVDIVYVPLDTALLVEARRRGHRTVDGLGMLLHQGRPGFEAWFGTPVRVTRELRAAVLTTLTGDRGDHSWPDRLDRHGQEHRRRACCGGSACRCTTPMPWCIGCSGRAAGRCARSRRCFPGVRDDAGGDRPAAARAARVRRSAGAAPARSDPASRWCAPAETRFVDRRGRGATSWSCSTSRCCTRPARPSALTMCSSSRRRRGCSASGSCAGPA